MTKETLERKLPLTAPGRVINGWSNGVVKWHIRNATPGLYTLDIEHIPEEVVSEHNNAKSQESIDSRYRQKLCVHNCPNCFNDQKEVYAKGNRILTLDETLKVIDDAREIAREERHEFESVKFLGPGELLLNPQLFKILEEYKRRKIQLNIFTKGAVLGSDELALKYQGMPAKELVERLATFYNSGILINFQSFNEGLQDTLVTSTAVDGSIQGLRGYSKIREQALENLFFSRFYSQGVTDRVCIINAPIVPENIEESFDIYQFFTERGTPVVMTPSMVSGKGCNQYMRPEGDIRKFHEKLVELYARIYKFNLDKGIQTDEQIKREGIASYVGAEPCNQASVGLYLRANGIIQMCPGRFDKETIFGNVFETPLREVWQSSPNRQRGISNPQNLINNHCPAKDGHGAFPDNFYDRVMQRYEELKNK
jgi:MoaA/NifB/PqqE/SkfB family radical SAM enzyme